MNFGVKNFKTSEIVAATKLWLERQETMRTAQQTLAALAAPGWVEGTRVGVPSVWPGQSNALFLNTDTGVCEIAGQTVPVPLPNVWVDVDLTRLNVPSAAIAAMLSGFLIITDGTESRAPDLALAFQKPGALSVPPSSVYICQALATGPLAGAFGGIRTNFDVTVPLTNGAFQFGWLRGDPEFDWATTTWPDKPLPGSQPQHASYGFNVTVQGYLVP